MRIKSLLIVALLVAAAMPAMQAQNIFEVSSNPVNRVRSDGLTELSGTVSFRIISATNTIGVISIDYSAAVNVAAAVAVVAGPGGNAATVMVGAITTSTVGGVASIVNIPLIAAGVVGDTITLTGVRINATTLNGGGLTVDVSASPGLSFVAGQTQDVPVINASSVSKDVTTTTAATILTDGTTIVNTGTITVTEGFASAWKTVAQEGPGALNAYQLRVQVNLLPAGVTLAVAVANTSAGLTVANISGLTLSSTVNVATFAVTTSNLAATELVTFGYVVAAGAGPYAVNTFPITVTAFPNVAGSIPQMQNNEMGGAPALAIIPGTTTLLFPFASVTGAIGVDTGVAIANTSLDMTAFPTGNAVAVDGAITFHFFPNDGTAPFAVTLTAPTGPNDGLDPNGLVVAGSTFVALLSDVLPAGTDFSGYVIAVCNFTHGHGIAFAGDFVNFVQTIAGLVIPDPTLVPRAAVVPTGGEGLLN